MQEVLSILEEFPMPAAAATSSIHKSLRMAPRPRAVLFDVYGTLVCSVLGDLDDQRRQSTSEDSFVQTANRFGFSRETGRLWHQLFFEAIAAEHEDMRQKGIGHAEVLVDRIWEAMITRAGGDPAVNRPRTLAAYREMIANPVRPFAGVAETLRRLRSMGLRLGIVSNSQFYTMPILARALGIACEELFEAPFVFLSYRLGFAKPEPHFFRLVRTTLLAHGIGPEETLVVGNDEENDIQAAQIHGFQTVLFCGNEKSVRLSQGESRPRLIYNYESLLASLQY
ncbi:MAG: HAD family hydrolase [Deltaproteobacteria bacterium]|nr:HAD family hydrolase [Deltaproteobacteria bacterium]MBW2071233.1 HAD family hydrolase [Deltaproteobacteria bacterium]